MPKRTDINQTEIINALRRVGATVHILSNLGDGCPDLLCGYRGKNYLLEVKQPGNSRNLTPAQRTWHQLWRGQAVVIETTDHALRVIGAIR